MLHTARRLVVVLAALAYSISARAQPATPAVAAPSEESRLALDGVLQRLRSDAPTARRAALDAILALDASDIPAIRARLVAPLGRSHFGVHAAMVEALRNATGGRPGAEADLLEALMNAPARGPDTQLATERIALARAVGAIRSAEAGRALFAFGQEHQRIFRMETLRIIRNTMRDYILPALIEVRRPSDETRGFIRQIRESLRRVTPGDCVQTRDNALLAEILRDFGSTRQQDAINVVVSFVNSDRSQVRDAARWAVTQYGRDTINVLRTAYENDVGSDANPLWGWERLARELYAAYDRRLVEAVTPALEQGLAAAREEHYAVMLERFEYTLARYPLFERRTEMVAPLFAYARQLEHRDATQAAHVYALVLHIDPDGASAPAARSALLFLRAENALGHGVADPELYRAAVRADGSNARARAQLEAVAQLEVVRARKRRRVLLALGLLTMALAALGIVLHRMRSAAAAVAVGSGEERT